MAPKAPRLKTLSGLSSHPHPASHRHAPIPVLEYPPLLFARPKLLVSLLQVILFLPKPRLAQTIPLR